MPNSGTNQGGGLAVRGTDWLISGSLLLLVLLAHAASPVTTSTDSAWTFHVSASILQEGDLDLDEYLPLMDLDRDYRLREVDGSVYYYYPAATPLLVAPVLALADSILSVFQGADLLSYLASHGPNARTAQFEKLVASAIVAISAVLMYLVARASSGRGVSIMVALIFAFATSMWSTASRALWQHGPSVLCLTLALLLTVRSKDRASSIFFTGMLLCFAYLVRPTNALSLGFLGLYFLRRDRGNIWSFALGVLVVLVPYLVQNVITYSNVLPPYSYQLFERLGTPKTILEAMLGTLFSPNRGVFVFSPVFFFAAYGAGLAFKRSAPASRNLDLILLAILVSHWLTTSLFEDWGGAWSIGPRYFVDVIPYLAYFLVPFLNSGALKVPAWRITFALAVAVSALVQYRGAVSPYPFMWNGKPRALVEAPERKWDWSDLQFLRGLCPDDPLEGRAPACWIEDHG